MTDDWRWADEHFMHWFRIQLRNCLDDAVTLANSIPEEAPRAKQFARAHAANLRDAFEALPKESS